MYEYEDYGWDELHYFLLEESRSKEFIEHAVKTIEHIDWSTCDRKNETYFTGNIWRAPPLVPDWETRLAVSLIDPLSKKKLPEARKNCKIEDIPSSEPSFKNVPRSVKKSDKKLPNPPSVDTNEGTLWKTVESSSVNYLPTRGRPHKEWSNVDVINYKKSSTNSAIDSSPAFRFGGVTPPKSVNWQQKTIEWSRQAEAALWPIKRGAKRGRPSDQSRRARKPPAAPPSHPPAPPLPTHTPPPLPPTTKSTNISLSMANLELARVLQFLQKTYNH